MYKTLPIGITSHALDCLKDRVRSVLGDTASCFLSTIEDIVTFLSPTLKRLMHTLNSPLRVWGKEEGQHFLLLSFLAPLKKTNSVYFFLFWGKSFLLD